jgi:hypothetical protein
MPLDRLCLPADGCSLIDACIALATADFPERWAQCCEFAYEIEAAQSAGRQRQISPDEAARKRLIAAKQPYSGLIDFYERRQAGPKAAGKLAAVEAHISMFWRYFFEAGASGRFAATGFNSHGERIPVTREMWETPLIDPSIDKMEPWPGVLLMRVRAIEGAPQAASAPVSGTSALSVEGDNLQRHPGPKRGRPSDARDPVVAAMQKKIDAKEFTFDELRKWKRGYLAAEFKCTIDTAGRARKIVLGENRQK